MSEVLAGWIAVGLSVGFAAVVGPCFRDLILRREDEWHTDLTERTPEPATPPSRTRGVSRTTSDRLVTFETGPRCSGGSVRTSGGVPTSAARRG